MVDPIEDLNQKYLRSGHPSIEELAVAQGVKLPQDPRDLLGNFWPDDESPDAFLNALYEWRGRKQSDPAA